MLVTLSTSLAWGDPLGYPACRKKSACLLGKTPDIVPGEGCQGAPQPLSQLQDHPQGPATPQRMGLEKPGGVRKGLRGGSRLPLWPQVPCKVCQPRQWVAPSVLRPSGAPEQPCLGSSWGLIPKAGPPPTWAAGLGVSSASDLASQAPARPL